MSDPSPELPKWKRREDVDGPFWEIDIPIGGGRVNIMVSKGEAGPGIWGYSITDGGIYNIATVDRFKTRKEAMRDALVMLDTKIQVTRRTIGLLRRDLAPKASK
jgi:hypothetical protein